MILQEYSIEIAFTMCNVLFLVMAVLLIFMFHVLFDAVFVSTITSYIFRGGM